MPSFQWKGIDLTGAIQKGLMRAHSQHELEYLLIKKDIALLSSRQCRSTSFLRPFTREKIIFFDQMARLLSAGLFLNQALEIAKNHAKNTHFRDIIEDIRLFVERGGSLGAGCALYADIFDAVTVNVVQAGQESGSLHEALSLLAYSFTCKEQFAKKLRTAALIPIITFSVFLIVAVLLVLCVLPVFAHVYASLGRPMPASITMLMAVVAIITSFWFLASLMVGIMGAMVIHRFIRPHLKIKRIFFFKLTMPWSILRYEIHLSSLLFSLGLLIDRRISLPTALAIIKDSLTDKRLKQQISTIEAAIWQGYSLHDACCKVAFASPDVQTLIYVGQETGSLGKILMQASHWYQERINKKFHVVSTIFQPTLMILLGVLILGLIAAIYLPLFDLSYHIS